IWITAIPSAAALLAMERECSIETGFLFCGMILLICTYASYTLMSPTSLDAILNNSCSQRPIFVIKLIKAWAASVNNHRFQLRHRNFQLNYQTLVIQPFSRD